VHIIVECPHCHNRFQIEPSLRGQRLRCNNCRKIYDVNSAEVIPEVDEADFAPIPDEPPAPPALQTSGTVGDIIPLLNAEVAAPSPPRVTPPAPSPETVEASWAGEAPLPLGQVIDVPPPKAAPTWQQAPPVRQPGATISPPAAPPEPAGEEDTSWPDLPPEEGPAQAPPQPPLPDGSTVADWSAGNGLAPPVRAAGGVTVPSPVPAAAASPLPPANPPNWPLRILAALIVLALGSLGAFAIVILIINGDDPETRLRERAEKHYDKAEFAEASKLFNDLELSFPESDRQTYYRFMTRLGDVRDTAYRRPEKAEDSKKARENLGEFLRNCEADPEQGKFLKEFGGDLRKTGLKLSDVLAAWAEELAKKPQPEAGELLIARTLLNEAREALGETRKYRPPEELPVQEKLQARLDHIDTTVERYERIIQAVEVLRNVLHVTPPTQAVAALREHLARESRNLPDLRNHPDVGKLLNEALAKHRNAINYTVAKPAPPAPADDDPDRLTNLLITPPVGEQVLKAPAREETIFSVARGVLYALDAETGKPRWAVRVGSDAPHPPLWLPRLEKGPPLALVLSADRATATAREALTGKPHWSHRLQSPCLGRPLLVNGRIYLPGLDGRIDELDLAGKLLGYFQVGYPLTAGAAHEEGTNLLFVPEDSFTVYVLDVVEKKCVGILYSQHPSGSLRCEPVVVNGADGESKGHLILCQADGVDATRLRAFPLPITNPDPDSEKVLEFRLTGWVSAPPYQNGETLAVVTDAGLFKLLGIKQKGNHDPDLFPLLDKDVQLRGDGTGFASQISYADGYEYWALTQGVLHRQRMAFDRRTGPKLVERGSVADLGSPLHASQTDAAGRTLYVTTRTSSGRSCQTTAIGLSEGGVRWRRQLGLVPRTVPLGLGSRVLVQDQGGALFLFDAEELKQFGWIEAGQELTAPAAETVLLRSLPTKAGNDAYVLAFKGQGPNTVLQVRRLAADQKGLEASQDIPLPEGINGVPGVWDDHLILPLASGILYRQPLGDERGAAGRDWRSSQAEPGAPGFVVPVSKAAFLVSDGDRKVRHFAWPQGGMGKQKGYAELKRRIVAPPALLPPSEDGALRVCVADAGEVLTLLQGDKLARVREWPLGGPVTAGPFARGGAAGCVVEKRRLVWIDPGQEKIAWEYPAPADIVGEPVLADGVLVMADQSGRIAALDPKTGEEVGPPYVFRDSVCPTAAPLPFGEGRLLVLLSDGTAAVLPLPAVP
jgi:hypothetical protein